jgi:hypothetical protein
MASNNSQTLDSQTLDSQTLDSQTLDSQTLDSQTLDSQNPSKYSYLTINDIRYLTSENQISIVNSFIENYLLSNSKNFSFNRKKFIGIVQHYGKSYKFTLKGLIRFLKSTKPSNPESFSKRLIRDDTEHVVAIKNITVTDLQNFDLNDQIAFVQAFVKEYLSFSNMSWIIEYNGKFYEIVLKTLVQFLESPKSSDIHLKTLLMFLNSPKNTNFNLETIFKFVKFNKSSNISVKTQNFLAPLIPYYNSLIV